MYAVRLLQRKYRRYKSALRMHELVKSKVKSMHDKDDRRFMKDKAERLFAQAHNRLFEYNASKQMLEKQLLIHIYIVRDKSPEKIYFKERGKHGKRTVKQK